MENNNSRIPHKVRAKEARKFFHRNHENGFREGYFQIYRTLKISKKVTYILDNL